MAKVLENCLYNKIKLLHKISCLVWFIQKHALDDAKKANDTSCYDCCKKVEEELGKCITYLKDELFKAKQIQPRQQQESSIMKAHATVQKKKQNKKSE